MVGTDLVGGPYLSIDEVSRARESGKRAVFTICVNSVLRRYLPARAGASQKRHPAAKN
jgi:hypothetical protein